MWVVVALSIFIALTALVLSIPVDLVARVEVHGKTTAQMRVGWLFGRVSKAVRSGEGQPQPPKARSAKKKRHRTKWSRSAGARLGWDLLHVSGLRHSVVCTIGRLLRCIKMRSLQADFRVDLGDPADTAMLVGAASQVAMFADLRTPYAFRLMPAFDGEALLCEGEAEVEVRLHPICTIPPILGLLCTTSALKALVLVIRSRWKKDD